MTNWRAIHSDPWIAQAALTRNAIETFLPLIPLRVRRRGYTVTRLAPLFHGYIFADVDDFAATIVRRCQGIIRILGTRPLPDEFISAMRDHMHQPHPQWTPGQLYALRRPGALADLIVRLERLDNHNRAVVSMHFLGATRETTVSVSELDAPC